MSEMKAYDTPKALIQNMDYDSPPTRSRILSYNSSQIEKSYDVPRSNLRMSIHDSNSSISDTFMGEIHNMGPLSHYDIPKKTDTVLRTPDTSSMELMMYDIPNANQTIALETLKGIETELVASIKRLTEFISFDWRSVERLKLTINDIKLNVNQFLLILNRFIEFIKYALENVAKADDKRLLLHIEPVKITIVNAAKSIEKLIQDIDLHGWTVENLTIWDGKSNSSNDSLDQIMTYARLLIEDHQITRITLFLQRNVALLSHQNSCHKLNSDENNHAAASGASTQEMEPIYSTNDPNDRPIIVFYGTQIVCHIKFISKAVDAFLQSVERNQPPKYFLTFGKLVISNAFNIINAGDIIQRNISKSDIKFRIIKCTNSLSDAVKNFVTKTKRAAQHFPSVIAVQEMVDSVIKVSHLAYELKLAILDYLNP